MSLLRWMIVFGLVFAGWGAAPAQAQWAEVRYTANADARGDLALAQTPSGGLAGFTSGVCLAGFAAFAAQEPPPARMFATELWAGPVVAGEQVFAVLYGARCSAGGLDLVELRPDGTPGARAPIPAARGYPWPLALAVSADGALGVAWAERGRLRAAIRPSGGALGAPVTLARARGIDALSPAFEAGGRLLVAFARKGRVSVASRAGVERVGPASGRGAPVLHVTAGRAVVAWSTADGGEEQNAPTRLYAAIREPGAKRFGRARRIDTDRGIDFADSSYGPPRVALGSDGRALLAWDAFKTPRHVVRSAAARPGHGFGRPRTLSGGHAGGVALDAGTALVSWTRAGTVMAAVSGAAETVGRGERVRAVRAGFAPDGRPRVSWISGAYDAPPVLHVATR